jgi:signal transduction histidine kinase
MAELLAPLRRLRTYERTAYLLLAFPLGLAYFVFLVTALATGIGLAVTLIGLPILAVTIYAWRRLASCERRLIGRLLGTEIPDPYRPLHEQTRLGRVQERIADPATWKDLVFLFAEFPFGIVAFALTTAVVSGGLGFLLAPLYYWAIPDVGDWTGLPSMVYAFLVMPVGALITVGGVHLLDRVARAWAGWAQTMLGSSEDPELSARVAALEGASARVIEAADAERRNLERDLHDGAQQRLVAMALTLRLAKSKAAAGEDASELLGKAEEESRHALTELRDLARGIHPAILTNRGLAAALGDVASRAPVPVEVTAVPDERLPDPVEAAVYFIVSEALTNVAKHAHATGATVSVAVERGAVSVEVADDGVGGVDLGDGSGLQGLADRAAALGGAVQLESPAGGGTRVSARLPVAGVAPAEERTTVLTEEAATERRSRGVGRLRAHAAVACGVLGTLVLIWFLTSGGYFWPAWPIAAWGLLLAIHSWVVLGRRRMTESSVRAAGGVRALKRRRGIETRAALIGALVSFLVVVWAISGAGYFWPAWAMLGLGLLLVFDLALMVGGPRRD